MKTRRDLEAMLSRLDGKGYKAYKELKGRYAVDPNTVLFVDHVQGDPFAAPSRVRIRISSAKAGFPAHLYSNKSRRIGLCSYLTACFADRAESLSRRRGSGRSGSLEISRPGQQVLERNSVVVCKDYVEARFRVGLPAAGRRILGRQAADLLLNDAVDAANTGLVYSNLDRAEVARAVETNEDADVLRSLLPEMGLVAFVADGSILARRSGVDDRPMVGRDVVFFESPDSMAVEVELPNKGKVRGMGIPKGITLIVGGGFHGKSSLLNALQMGVYNHVPGDGRELAVTVRGAVKIRAEDGRSVAGVDISPFISDLPGRIDTSFFNTENASGSTSQAANIMEALEAGAEVLLLDEDTCATNFMIRDHRMQELVAKEKEPITPFIDRVGQLFEEHGVSTILVMGGSGDYFDTAHKVVAMDTYLPKDVTERAKEIAARMKTGRIGEAAPRFSLPRPRRPLPASVDPSKGRRDVNIKTRDIKTIQFGTQTIDMSAVEQLAEIGQTRALAKALDYARVKYIDGARSLAEILDLVDVDMDEKGLDALAGGVNGDYARFRRFELAAALNRLRTLGVEM